ncbi:MAG TPA: hypothetical protein PK530_09430 [Anaerolineales bacterium]|nr:hypothetical protein [Anaerolineales bacterium]
MSSPKPSGTAQIFRELVTNPSARRKRITGQDLPPALKLLRTFQSERLARTHADLLASPRHGPACSFFLTDIYAPRDFSQRDHDAETLYKLMNRFLPEDLLYPLAIVLKLNAMTHDLDERLADALVHHLGVTDTITPEMYAEGYRICDNYQEREQQIDMLLDIGDRVDRLVKSPLTAPTLALANLPAKTAGWDELHHFLERGYKAFKHMKGSEYFLKTITTREKDILHRIFSAHPDPFGIR